MSAEVVIYTTLICPYCVEAKKLLAKKGVPYHEIDVSDNPLKRQEMIQKSGGRRSVPQIFIAQEAIGGYSDLRDLDDQGWLDQKLFPSEHPQG